MQKLPSGYTLLEEIIHVITHGFGAVLSFAGLSWMLYLSLEASDPWRIAASLVYGVTLVMLFTASAVAHYFHSSPKRPFYDLLDQCAIYLLIAGTYTPFLIVAMRDGLGWLLFGIVWAMATAGILSQIWFKDRYLKAVLASYLAMGWLIVPVLPRVVEAIGFNAFVWLAAGGLLYTIGVIFYVRSHIRFNHAVWHVFVLAGGVCHFLAIAWHVLPSQPAYRPGHSGLD